VTPSDRGLPGEIDVDTARAICAAVKARAGHDRAVSVALSVEDDLGAITTMARVVQPDVLHLCGLAGAVPPEAVRVLRSRLPGVRIMQAIAVSGPEAIDTALAYQPVADYLILDTQAPDIDGIGASGQTHDWRISRAIVEQTQIPVILAGGLSPENVAGAIRAVQPWGVDSLTHTNRPLAGGGFRKDIERVRQFVGAARGALD
jgi:phosphoribosylanthranilate isomerase